jgi:hypothetical protein
MLYSDATSEVIAARGEEIYQPLRDELESQHKGKIFVVDIETEDYEIADKDLEATERLLAKNPDAVTYGLHIGFGPIYKLGFRSYGWKP